MFPKFDDLEQVETAELETALETSLDLAKDADSLEAVYAGLTSGDEPVAPAAAVEAVEAGVAQIEAIQAELASRQVEAPDFAALAEKAADLNASTEEVVEEVVEEIVEEATEEAPASEDVDPGDENDAEPVEAPEAELAPAPKVPAQAKRKAAPAVSPAIAAKPAPFAARADIPGVPTGQRMDMDGVVAAFKSRIGSGVSGDKAYIARMPFEVDAEFTLTDDVTANAKRLKDHKTGLMAGDEALTAALCSPGEVLYDLKCISNADRPVAEFLSSYQATRGQVSIPQNTPISDYVDAVGIDIKDGDLKPCIEPPCQDSLTFAVEPVSQCICWDNLSMMSWPERVEDAICKTAAVTARAAETKLLDQITANSTVCDRTGDTYGGAYSSLLGQIVLEATAYRSRNRMGRNATLEALFPYWVADLLAVDGYRQLFGCCEGDTLESALSRHNIRAGFYVDEATGDGQIFGASCAPWPAQVAWYLWAPGTFLHLAGPGLDLGLTRDNASNAENKACTFAEFWEGLGYNGCESIKVLSEACPNGGKGGAIDPVCPVV